MAKAILICGKLCSGKTTYAKELCAKQGAVLLSADELMLTLFGQHCGEKHDEYAEKTQRYLFEKSLEIMQNGVDVVLDWGFWTKAARRRAWTFYASRDIPCEVHYLDVDEITWRARINNRNRKVSDGAAQAYFVDEPLLKKSESLFVAPGKGEIDVWVQSKQEETEADL